jgi:hypothetical protein
MSNRLRTEIQEEQAEQELTVEEQSEVETPERLFRNFLALRKISTESATKALPFIFYVALLGMIYIGNRHLSENTIRDIDKLTKEVKELSWDYKTTKADFAFKSTLSEVAKRTDTLGLHQPVEPPQKLTDEEVQP